MIYKAPTSIKNQSAWTWTSMWTNFTFFGRNVSILLINYQPRMDEILTVIFTLNC